MIGLRQHLELAKSQMSDVNVGLRANCIKLDRRQTSLLSCRPGTTTAYLPAAGWTQTRLRPSQRALR